ncbi:ATPase, YjeE family [Thermanaerovibrio velox DSM 12556]|uniref:tRNA threonylcarbamoyladenosine biosynthesis protein TsaE n=1 Tax=Thermanaerovibrio velox DSM 12556 TaxID=926567 RepID=H0URN0_9BACT|nr:tRNA (adenosine(37)-N6)-threonylcarbamoyltransferase complex ATPase subunit type 1 TsaE [Thermanaerovibrio velox]EHM09969.1 ATPase, YjeE family [Thermanaerovibrio velox DSM 12556]
MIGKKVFKIQVDGLDKMEELGRALGGSLYPGLLVCLDGELGTGKTTLVQYMGMALGIRRMQSPSFILAREYDSKPPLVHVDLYRLSSDEVEGLALWEYLDDGRALLVEWASRMALGGFIDRWEIFIAYGDSLFSREISAWASSSRSWEALTAALSGFSGSVVLEELSNGKEINR